MPVTRIWMASFACLLILFGSAVAPRPVQAVPGAVYRSIMQLADAAGALSSSSCRDPETADRAVRAINMLIRHLQYSKFVTYGEQRDFRQERVIPVIRERRKLTHSSRDCAEARVTVREAERDWTLAEPGTRKELQGLFSLTWGAGGVTDTGLPPIEAFDDRALMLASPDPAPDATQEDPANPGATPERGPPAVVRGRR
jgi:hypothetical protein